MSGAKVKIGKHQTGIHNTAGPNISRFSFQLYPFILASSPSTRSSTHPSHPSSRRHLRTRRRLSILIVSRLRCPPECPYALPSVDPSFRFFAPPLPRPPSHPLKNFVSSFHRWNASLSLDLEPHSSHVQRWPRLWRHCTPAGVVRHLRSGHSGMDHCIRWTVCC